MKRILRRHAALSGPNDSGYALAVVIGIGLIMIIMIAGSLTVTTSGVTRADTDQDRNGAEAAAYAGVAEYQSRLSNDSTYYKYGNPGAKFTLDSGFPVDLPTGASVNPAFGINASGTWATIPTSDGSAPTASFRYEVDISKFQRSGVIRIQSTGRVGNVTRTLVADLKQEGFLDFLYFTDYETFDPDLFGGTNCNRYIWATPKRGNDCDTITFPSIDTFNGPVHTNDQMTVCGAKFNGEVTSSSTMVPNVTRVSGCPTTFFKFNGGPVYHSEYPMPPTNAEMKKETRNDLVDDVPRPGCLYTGPTTISFESGKMRVISPYTKFTNTASTKAGASNPTTRCGTPGSGNGALGSSNGALIDVLDANLVFVQNVPALATDANYWGTTTPSGFTCTNKSNRSAAWSFGASRYPLANERIPDTSADDAPAYGCTNGDVYVKGEVNGAITIASENYVYVIGDITYSSTDTSILGLVGNNAIWVWNPVNSSNQSLIGGSGRTINAALLSVAHTFMVQNYNRGPNRGTLTINGAIAQKFRGTVVTYQTNNGVNSVSTGYAKNYNYDERLRVTAPPKFLSPVSTTYGVTQFANVGAAYDAKGNVLSP
jgi:hypothetical protein